MNINEVYNIWAKLDVNELALEAIEDSSELIIDTITEDQLYDKGQDGNGNMLPGEYSPYTIMVKEAKGQRIDHITLKDTSDLYSSMQMLKEANSVRTIFTDWKAPKLYRDYGAEIGSISKPNLSKLIKSDIKPDFILKMREKLNL